MTEGRAGTRGYRVLREVAAGVAVGAMAASFWIRLGGVATVLVVLAAVVPVLLVASGAGLGRDSFAQTEEAYLTRRWLVRRHAPLAAAGALVATVWSVLGTAASFRLHAVSFAGAAAIAVVAAVWLRVRYPMAGVDYE